MHTMALHDVTWYMVVLCTQMTEHIEMAAVSCSAVTCTPLWWILNYYFFIKKLFTYVSRITYKHSESA